MEKSVASAVFDTQAEAQRAVAELREAGVTDSSISVIARHEGRTTTADGRGDVTDDDHRNLLRGIVGGGALGAGLGVAALLIPGVGPLAAGGALAAGAAGEGMAIGAAAGAAAGTLNEVLKDHGISDEDATYYEDRIKSGGIFVSVNGTSLIDQSRAQEILYANGGHNAARSRTTDKV